MTIQPGLMVWPGNPPVEIESVREIAKGASSNISLLHLGSHTATHRDAPRHFFQGAPGVDKIPPDILVGPTRVVQLTDVRHVDRAALVGLDLEGVTRLLIGTRNSALLEGDEPDVDFAFISEDAAKHMVNLGLRLVGLDYLSVEEYQREGRPTHNTLLGVGMVVLEGLDLTGVPEGDYELICLPLKIKGADGAPARVLLREL